MLREIRRSGLFDPVYYLGAYPAIHPIYRKMPLRHYLLFGEARGYRPNPDFCPEAYLKYNPDIAEAGISPLYHFVTSGRDEGRPCKELPEIVDMPAPASPRLHADPDRQHAPYAVVAHIYYPDLWPEFERRLAGLEIEHDLHVTLTYRGEETEALAETIRARFPGTTVIPLQNRGRDMLPFVTLLSAGLLDGYRAVCKIHTKKSPHREDGDHWRDHLISGILPEQGLQELLDRFEAMPDAAFWVADGQHYTGRKWWGSNCGRTRDLLRRVEIDIDHDSLAFPAGSMYWVKPLMLGLLRAMHLREEDFEPESGQVDGTTAHALERCMGFLATASGQRVLQSTELAEAPPPPALPRPGHVSAFYLPQFHPIPENDAWWGKGFTEWRSVTAARPLYHGHTQPLLPADLGFYDLRLTEVMGEQAELARNAGIDAFCVYHYWFDGRRVLEAPLDRLLERPEIDFPFYLCWANESWRRNWDGLSGVVLLEQTYGEGFERALVESSLPYMRDPRYQRPDGTRPRFMIYRPEDMPDPASSVERMRKAWRAAGIGEVELGAVRFHIQGENPVADDLFDFWVEMPPHGLVTADDYLFGGPQGNLLGREVAPGFRGLVYDYVRVIDNAVSPAHTASLPPNTICGAMPGWDNTARRGLEAHMAHGAHPGRFDLWLRRIAEHRLAHSYRGELFLNAWNEWAEKAVLEPSDRYGRLCLEVLASRVLPNQRN